jgi:hypothetical protein
MFDDLHTTAEVAAIERRKRIKRPPEFWPELFVHLVATAWSDTQNATSQLTSVLTACITAVGPVLKFMCRHPSNPLPATLSAPRDARADGCWGLTGAWTSCQIAGAGKWLAGSRPGLPWGFSMTQVQATMEAHTRIYVTWGHALEAAARMPA